MSTIAERVAAGAAFLDEHDPGWQERIDLDTLYIGSCERCILGQLHEDYAFGASWVYRTDYTADTHGLGFMFRGAFSHKHGDAEDLTDEWKRVIRERRGGAS
jgi:hypothetical protein